jgi:DNA polymerase-3 subunit gamma/tau
LQKKNLGDFNSDLSISEAEVETITTISKNLDTSTIIIFWQFILKALEELSLVANPVLSLEMLVIRLLHLKGLPSYEDVINLINSNSVNENTLDVKSQENLIEKKEIDKSSKEQIKNTTQTKLEPKPNPKKQVNETITEEILSFEDLVHLSSKKKEIELKYDLERNVNLIKFSAGKIDISFNENLSKNFVRKLSEKLLEWTGKRWLITLAKEEGQKTFSETKLMEKKITLEKEKNGEFYKKFEKIFPDIELIDILKKD